MAARQTGSPVAHRHATGERAERGKGRRTSGLTLQRAARIDAAEPRRVGPAAARHGRAPGRGQHDRKINVSQIAKAPDEAIGPPARRRNESHMVVALRPPSE